MSVVTTNSSGLTHSELFDLSSGKMKEIIVIALTSKTRGPSQPYNFLIDHITKITKSHLKNWLGGLKQCVSMLSEKNHKELLFALWQFDWFREERETIIAYKNFLFHLVAAQNSFISTCFLVVGKAFIIPDHKMSIASPVTHRPEEIVDLIHSILEGLLQLVPNSRFLLVQNLRQLFPQNSSTDIKNHKHRFYVENILCITLYCPSLQEPILELIVEKLIQIDANIIGFSQEEQDIFPHDEQVQEEQQRELLANILDDLMETTFKYLKKQVQVEETKVRIFEFFLEKIFHTKIISSQKLKYVQFLVFYLTHFKPSPPSSFPEDFMDYLFKKFINKSAHYSERQISLDYLASYICRASFVPINVVSFILTALVTELHCYLDTPDKVMAPILEDHLIFYIICQAVFYIITYLSNALLENGGYEYLLRLQLERFIISPLNPLKFCCRSVAEAFATVVDKLNLMSISCEELIEQNKQTKFNFDDRNPLGTHFPFDPIYLDLPQSFQHIEPFYNSKPDQWNEDEDQQIDREKSESASETSMSYEHESSLDMSIGKQSQMSYNNGSFGSYFSPN